MPVLNEAVIPKALVYAGELMKKITCIMLLFLILFSLNSHAQGVSMDSRDLLDNILYHGFSLR